MKIDFTVATLPASGDLKKACGLPFGMTVTPLAEDAQVVSQSGNQATHPKSIPRCTRCFAYINVYCPLNSSKWTCSLCGTQNTFSLERHFSYLHRIGDQCPFMLLSNVVDLHLHEPGLEDEETEDRSKRFVPEGFPVTVALIDTYCDAELLDSIKSALTASLEVLPPDSLIGILTFDDRVRLFDVRGSAPSCRSLAILDGVPLMADLEDILPLERFLAPVGVCKEVILQALDHIDPTPVSLQTNENTTTLAPALPDIQRSGQEPDARSQAYGTVLQALLQYFKPLGVEKEESNAKGDVVHTTRILSFLTGPPTMGLGSLHPYLTSKAYVSNKGNSAAAKKVHKIFQIDTRVILCVKELETAAAFVSEFYTQTGIVAASLGVVMDLFLLPSRPICLEVLSALASLTGGGMWLYRSPSETMLTQDLFRHLSMVHAQMCLMRVRLPPQLKISKSYGRLIRDPLYEDLYHIISCDPHETFSLDVDHMEDLVAPVTLQIAFQYTVPVFESIGEAGTQFELQKRLRVATMQVGVSMVPAEIYEKIKPDVVATFLMHKVMVASKAEGVLKAAVLLQDWLIILAASYKRHVPSDSFIERNSFQPLIRLVYGLLRSPVLLGGYIRGTDDHQIYVQHLWTSLPPADLQKAIYPNLSSFRSPDEKAFPCHSLSRVAMKLAQAPLFLMDAYDAVGVLYLKDSDLPYPPSPSSLIRQSVNELRQSRKNAPRYFTSREGDTNSKTFMEKLLDDPLQLKEPLEGECGVVFNGYLSFVDWIKFASEEYKTTSV